MNTPKFHNLIQSSTKKPGRKIAPLPIAEHSEDEIIETFADILIERFLEEKNKKTTHE